VLLDNVVNPDTFNDDIKVVVFEKVLNPDTFNLDTNVVSFNVVQYAVVLTLHINT
jgi:hypothetical protein